MDAVNLARHAHFRPTTIVLRATVVFLTLTTAAIHWSLGGLLFTLNAAGYAVLAAAMVAPAVFVEIRWLVRLGLIGFTAATIGGWVLLGPRFGLAYFDKAIEVSLIALLFVELWREDGGPLALANRAYRQVMHARSVLARLVR